MSSSQLFDQSDLAVLRSIKYMYAGRGAVKMNESPTAIAIHVYWQPIYPLSLAAPGSLSTLPHPCALWLETPAHSLPTLGTL